MNSCLNLLSDESIHPIIIDVQSYGFHLLSWDESEESFNLSLDYDGENPPSKEEIEEYLYSYIKWYALSRWFERVAFWLDVPINISPIEDNNWASDKIVNARWWKCPIYFIEDIEEFTLWSELLDDKDILIVYVWDIDLDSRFLPYINETVDVMREKRKLIFKSKELKQWVKIGKILLETPMTFATIKGWMRGVRLDASKIKWMISYKIVNKMYRYLWAKWDRWKMNPSWWKVTTTKHTTASLIDHTLRL